MEFLLYILSFAYAIVVFLQTFMAYGSAYRMTKREGDSGVALFLWLFVFNLAATIPGLGIILWKRSKTWESPPPIYRKPANPMPSTQVGASGANAPSGQKNAHRSVTPKIEDVQCYCPLCETKQLTGRKYCYKCGAKFVADAE
ncbi:MAG: hypothetical protein FWF10_00345 [Clostridiales bacterium]|nr:hypothetical protein [Clostridiales bacterium]